MVVLGGGGGSYERGIRVSAETLEPLACFVRKLPKDSNLAEDDFPGLIHERVV